MTACTYGFPVHALACPALPWCGHEPNLPPTPKPLPDPEQMDIYEALEEEGG